MHQIKIRRLLVLPIVCIFLLLLICCNVLQNNPPSPPIISTPIPTPVSTPVVKPTPIRVLSAEEQIYQDANEIAKTHFKKYFTKCGDIYYWKSGKNTSDDSGTYAGKGEPTVAAEGQYYPPKILTAAEKLNHVDPQPVEWSGNIKIRFEVGRIVNCKGCLSGYDKEWKDKCEYEWPLSKAKGKWQIGDNRPYWGSHMLQVKCSDIPSDK